MFAFTLYSCKEDVEKPNGIAKEPQIHELYMNDNDGQATLYHMPLASIADLDVYALTDDNAIPYRLARQYAYIEFIANAQTFLPEYAWNTLMLSIAAGDSIPIALTNRPAVVYNYDDTPYYYEFGVIMNGQLLTTITVFANKMSDQLIAYVGAVEYLPYDFQYKRYVGLYPAVYYSDWNTAYSTLVYDEDNYCFEMRSVDDPCNVLSTNPLYILEERLANIPQGDIDVMNSDLSQSVPLELGEEVINSVYPSLSAYESYCSVLHDSAMSVLNERMFHLQADTIGDIFYLSSYQRGLIDSVLSETQTYTYYLPEYENNHLRFTHWNGYCGPAAMAWLYRGKWDTFYGMYLPLFGDGQYNTNNIKLAYSYNYSYAYYNTSSYICERYGGESSTYAWIRMSMEYDNGLCGVWYSHCHYLFGGQALFAGGIKYGLEFATSDKEEPYTTQFTILPTFWIYNYHNPLLIEGSPAPDYVPHYWAAIAVTFNKGFLGIRKNKFFLVTDNGALTKYHGYYPFWKAYNFWNLHYGWKQQNI